MAPPIVIKGTVEYLDFHYDVVKNINQFVLQDALKEFLGKRVVIHIMESDPD